MDEYINSHVIIPASIMRGFFIKGKVKQTFVYEIDNNTDILSSNIKKYGSVFAYYEPQTETALASIETQFGEVKNRIIQGLNNNGTYMRYTPVSISSPTAYIGGMCFRSFTSSQTITEFSSASPSPTQNPFTLSAVSLFVLLYSAKIKTTR